MYGFSWMVFPIAWPVRSFTTLYPPAFIFCLYCRWNISYFVSSSCLSYPGIQGFFITFNHSCCFRVFIISTYYKRYSSISVDSIFFIFDSKIKRYKITVFKYKVVPRSSMYYYIIYTNTYIIREVVYSFKTTKNTMLLCDSSA